MSTHQPPTGARLLVAAGTVRMRQERWFPERVCGTDLDNADFVALARSSGAKAQRVESVETLVQATLAGFEANKPTLLHVHTEPELIGPNGSIDSIRRSAASKN